MNNTIVYIQRICIDIIRRFPRRNIEQDSAPTCSEPAPCRTVTCRNERVTIPPVTCKCEPDPCPTETCRSKKVSYPSVTPAPAPAEVAAAPAVAAAAPAVVAAAPAETGTVTPEAAPSVTETESAVSDIETPPPTPPPPDVLPTKRKRKMGSSNCCKRCMAHMQYLQWLALLGMLLLWPLLYLLVTIPMANYLPTASSKKGESNDDTSTGFNHTYARLVYMELNNLGPRPAGFVENDVTSTQRIKEHVEKLGTTMHQDLYSLQVESMNLAANDFKYHKIYNRYQGGHAVAVLVEVRNAKNSKRLLINSHYDTVPSSAGAGDNAAMVGVMLEVLHQITHSREPLKNSIVFLFNGAKENPFHSSHFFMTEHKWAQASKLKAFINLESIGSGGREFLYRSQNHWLTKMYCKLVPSPYANTFLKLWKPTHDVDTDVYILNDFKLPGLELMYIDEGYMYHTKYDTLDRIPPGTLENTGRNLLALTRGIANSDKLDDIPQNDDTYDVYYDFWHLFMFHYSSVTAQIINFLVSIATFILVAISLCRMWAVTRLKVIKVLLKFLIILGFQLICTLLVSLVAYLTAIILDFWDNSMSWFSNRWLVFGLYVFPALLIQLLTVCLYFNIFKSKALRDSYILMMFLHAQSIIFAVICIILTFLSKPYAYMLMLVLVFYLIPLALNLVTRLHDTGYCWIILFLLFQIISFLYFTYLFHTTIRAIIPMMGRYDPEDNPDIYISALATTGTIMAMSFNTPLFHMYRKGIFLMIPLLVIIIVCFILAFTSVGFPYRAGSSPARLTLMIATADGDGAFKDTKVLFYCEDRRLRKQLEREGIFRGAEELSSIYTDKTKDLHYLPVYGYYFHKKEHSIFVLSNEPRETIPETSITAILSTRGKGTYTKVWDMSKAHPQHMTALIRITDEIKVINFWIDNQAHPTSNFDVVWIAFSTTKQSIRLTHTVEAPPNREKSIEIFWHYLYTPTELKRTKTAENILNSLPEYVHVTEWRGHTKHFIQPY